MSGALTYTGSTTISAGSLFLANATVSSSGDFGVAAGANLIINNNVTLGSLSGAGTVSFNGVLFGGSSAIELTVGGDNATTTYSGAFSEISTSASLTKIGTGAMTLTGSSYYSGATTVKSGTLALSGGGALADVTVAAPGVLAVRQSMSFSSLSGDGVVTLSNAAGVTLSVGDNLVGSTFSGAIGEDAGASGLTKVARRADPCGREQLHRRDQHPGRHVAGV